jgi:hypothetical protein
MAGTKSDYGRLNRTLMKIKCVWVCAGGGGGRLHGKWRNKTKEGKGHKEKFKIKEWFKATPMNL